MLKWGIKKHPVRLNLMQSEIVLTNTCIIWVVRIMTRIKINGSYGILRIMGLRVIWF